VTPLRDPGLISDRADPEGLDLEQCAREPIHVPGRIQHHGVLLAIDATGTLQQVSANSASLTDREPQEILGADLSEIVGEAGALAIGLALGAGVDEELQTLVSFWLPRASGDTLVDAVLHRVGALVLVELLRAGHRPRPVTFTDTYRRAQVSIARLDASASYAELLEVAAAEVRSLTGFDRVMVYRFDEDYNGEVVAEDRREDLNAFLGLRFPAGDIPPQARALYERSWLRLIADVHSTPAVLMPTEDTSTGEPLDLSRAWLRAVSPVHIEYLRNMGVAASMSVSLLRDGKLWGLIACHHHSGPHEPDYETSATVELLAQLISSRIVDRLGQEQARLALATQRTLGLLAAKSYGPSPLAEALTTDTSVTMQDLVAADGVFACIDGVTSGTGTVLGGAVHERLMAMAGDRPRAWDSLDALALAPGSTPIAGALTVPLGDGQYVVWYRKEVTQVVEWGGDPHNQAIAVTEGDTVRISPRRSFERWREEIRGRCLPWTGADLDAAALLRAQLIEGLYGRARQLASEALSLQLSLLPQRLPEPDGWTLAARYLPTAGGRVGGDWYDAFTLADGRLALVMGDVTGHGVAAAGMMGQLRNALRAYLSDAAEPSLALHRLDRMIGLLLPDEFATCVALVLDPSDGRVEIASYGHLPPLLTAADGMTTFLDVPAHPSLGLEELTAPARSVEFVLEPGATLTLYTDGMAERRTEELTVSLQRMASLSEQPGTPQQRCERLVTGSRDPISDDDATVLCIQRQGTP
jgi:chemotaxis family two-component system sensor kinase Cph1